MMKQLELPFEYLMKLIPMAAFVLKVFHRNNDICFNKRPAIYCFIDNVKNVIVIE